LRWFWWRINAWTELTGMIISFAVAITFLVLKKTGTFELQAWQELLAGVTITTLSWVTVTFVTRPTDDKVLQNFYRLVRPGGIGWDKVINKAKLDGEPITETATTGDLPRGIACMIAGCLAVYSTLFAVGYYMYAQFTSAVICTILAVGTVLFLLLTWNKLETR